MNYKKALILLAHTDDEQACCSTISRLIEMGTEIFVAVFSFCQESVPEGFKSDILIEEFDASMKTLGIELNHIYKYQYRVRHFPRDRQHILEELIRLKSKINPDLVLMAAQSDIHQDHNTITNEGIRAFKHSTILGYEFVQNNFTTDNRIFVEINQKHINKKLDVIRCYKSQAHKPYSLWESLESLAKVRGIQSGTTYAEAFEAIRIIVKL